MSHELHDREAEQTLLGCCLVSYDAIQTARPIISPNDFTTVDNQLVFEAILAVADEKSVADPLLVADYLEKTDKLNRAGGSGRIYELQASIVETESTEFYAEIVSELSIRRQLISNANTLIGNAQDRSIDLEDIQDQQIKFSDLQLVNPNKWKTKTTDELAAEEIPPIKWIIPELVPAGLTIIAGPPKIGKSFLCWNLAFAAAMQGVALSAITVEEQSNVLYLALDDDRKLLQQRHQEILKDQNIPKNVYLIDSESNVMLNSVGLHQLERYVDKYQTNFVIVDTWQHARPELPNTNKKTSYDIDYELLIPIRKFAHRKNIAIMLVTHTRKGSDLDNPFNMIQGSTGIQAGCDTLLMLTKEGDAPVLRTSGRRVFYNEYSMTLADGLWQMHEYEPQVRTSDEAERVLEALKEMKGEKFTIEALAKQLDVKKNTLEQRIKRMVDREQIIKIGRGHYVHPDYADPDNDVLF